MRDQYKILAEKYTLITEADHYDPYSFGSHNRDMTVIASNGEEYEVEFEDIDYGNVSKRWHYVIDKLGLQYTIDWSPYDDPTYEDIKLWLDLGKPGRVGVGPLNSKQLKQIQQEREIEKQRQAALNKDNPGIEMDI